MRHWHEVVRQVEALEDVPLDRALVGDLEAATHASGDTRSNALTFFTPTFKRFQSTEINTCSAASWPAVSITGADCALQCDHCRAKVLEPMLAATTPDRLWRVVNDAIDAGAKGMLLTGGSTHRNEVNYGPFWPMVRRIKNTFPGFRIACHTALMDSDSVLAMEQAGVDVAMLDVIGAQDTVTQVYHLRRSVNDFERTLSHLAASSMYVVPHIVVGLHYGHLLGEWNALDMVNRHRFDALVLVVAMPYYAPPKRPFKIPDPHAIGRFFALARQRVARKPLLLGCARPAGRAKTVIDTYAVMAGFDGIAHPAEGMVELATRLGKTSKVNASCCSMVVGEQLIGETVMQSNSRYTLVSPTATHSVEYSAPRLFSIRQNHIAGIPIVVE
jgi:uncharacterized radical SAM superfamily protein